MPSVKDHWAWRVFSGSKQFFNEFYHGEPLGLRDVSDPRAIGSDSSTPVSPNNETEAPFLWRPSNAKPAKKDTTEQTVRLVHDIKLVAMDRTTIRRRERSPDRLVVDEDEDARFKIIPKSEWKNFLRGGGWKSEHEHRMHFYRLNQVQFVFHRLQKKNPYRIGRLYMNFYNECLQQESGDKTSADLQGLMWRFEVAVAENKRDKNVETWSKTLTSYVKYILTVVMEATKPDSDYFRKDILMFNFRNKCGNDLQSVGMACLVGTQPDDDERPEYVSSILFKLCKFSNLCPRASDRERVRLVLDLHDDFTEDSILLSPLDVCTILESIQILPIWERKLIIFKAFIAGSCLGLAMVAVNEGYVHVPDQDHSIREHKIPTKYSITDQKYSKELYDRVKNSQLMAESKKELYEDALQGFDILPPGTIDTEDLEDTSSMPDIPDLNVAFERNSLTDSEDDYAIADDGLVLRHEPADLIDPSIIEVGDANNTDVLAVMAAAEQQPIDELRRLELSRDLNVNPEYIPDMPDVFEEQQRYLQERLDNQDNSNDFPLRRLPSPNSWMPDRHSDVVLNLYIFNQQIIALEEPPMEVSSSESDADEDSAHGDTFIGPSVQIGPAEDPRIYSVPADNDSRYRTFELFDSETGEVTRDIQQMSSSQWERYQRRICGCYIQRILDLGTEEELHFVSLAFPGNFLSNAVCLRDKTPEEKQRIIGPHSPKVLSEFKRRFKPDSGRWKHLGHHILVPHTNEEDWGTYPDQPEDLRAQALHEQTKRGPQQLVYELPAIQENPDEPRIYTPPSEMSSVSEVNLCNTNEGSTITTESDSISDEPSRLLLESKIQNVQQQLEKPMTEEDLLAIEARLAAYQTRWVKYFSKCFAQAELLYENPITKNYQESQFFHRAFVDDPPEGPLPEALAIKLTHTIPEEVSSFERESDLEFNPVPTPQRVQDNLTALSEGLQNKVSERLTSVALPSSVVPYYRHSQRTKGPAGAGEYVHPILGTIIPGNFDFTIDGFDHYSRREVQRCIQNPASLSPETGYYNLPAGYDFGIPYDLRDETENASNGQRYFHAGAMRAFFRQFLYPRSLTQGIRSMIRTFPKDSNSDDYQNVIPTMRENVPRDVLKQAGTVSMGLQQIDTRFEARPDNENKTTNEVYRPCVSIEKINFWEPTFFGKNAVRSWLPLISDVDTHCFTPLECFVMCCSKIAVLQRSMSVCHDSELQPEKQQIRHLRSSRDGFKYHCLTVCVGALRNCTWKGAIPHISGPWDLKLGGKIAASYFVGAVTRVTVSEAIRLNISEKPYLDAMKDREDVSKYYEEYVDEKGKRRKRRRAGVFPTSLTGLHRAVRNDAGEIIFYERILYEGWNYSCRVLAAHKEKITVKNSNDEEEKVHGGPRLHLVHVGPMEEEKLKAMCSFAYFVAQMTDVMNERITNVNKEWHIKNPKRFESCRFHQAMLPPGWKHHLAQTRLWLGDNAYEDFENLYGQIELGADIYLPLDKNPIAEEYFDGLQPYDQSHAQEHREIHIRIARNGCVHYVHEDLDEHAKLSEKMKNRAGDAFPSAATNYAAQVAEETRSERTKGRIETKSYSSAEFAFQSNIL